MSIVYETPFISGKDSLNNEFQTDGETIVIPGTLLISAISVMDDVTRAVTMDFKEAGNLVYVVGQTRDELGGSVFYSLRGHLGKNVPKVNPEAGKQVFDCLSAATEALLVRSCHDISDGGLAVALAEMAFAGGLGVEVTIDGVPVPADDLGGSAILFSESPSRFVVEIEADKAARFEKAMEGVPFGRIGYVTKGGQVQMSLRGKPLISSDIEALKTSWKKPLSF